MNIGPETGSARRSIGSFLTAELTPDWEFLVQQPWAKAMQTCPQDPIFHAEGDVWTHTRMVVDKLQAAPDFGELSEDTQRVLLVAAILHDIGKPDTTIEFAGNRIGSPGHARLGERMARTILWEEDFDLREQICAIVRLHGQPVWTLERLHPLTEVIRSSLRIPNTWLHRFARADMQGRICPDQDEMVLTVDLFREYCEEQSCLAEPWPFANAHSRFKFFRNRDAYPGELYNDTCFTLTMMCGLPGSGKDTFVSRLDQPIVSLDDLREQHSVRRGNKRGEGRVIQEAYEQAKTHARAGQDFVWNSTNLTRDLRSKLITALAPYRPYVKIHYLETSWSEVIRRREGIIPARDLRYMQRRLEMPQLDEAHEVSYGRT